MAVARGLATGAIEGIAMNRGDDHLCSLPADVERHLGTLIAKLPKLAPKETGRPAKGTGPRAIPVISSKKEALRREGAP